MDENRLRKYTSLGLKGMGVIRQVENILEVGTPDTNWLIDGVEGWIELKSIHGWPFGKKTPLRIPHYTTAQKRWGAQQLKHGGKWSLFIKVGREYLLFCDVAGLLVGRDGKDKKWLRENCTCYWKTSVDFDEMAEALVGRPARIIVNTASRWYQ